MINKIIKFICLTIVIIAVSFVFTDSAMADEDSLVVIFNPDPLFSEANFLPGDSVIRDVKVINNTTETKPIVAEAIEYNGCPNPDNVPTDDLSRALNIVIRIKGGSDLYGGSADPKTLFNFYQNSETYLSSVLGNGGEQEYEFEIIFPADKENEWQGASTTFDILIGFQGEEGGGSGSSGSSGGGGGGGLPPGLTITNEKAVSRCINNNTVNISWLTNYNATSRVIYCEADAGCKFNLSDTNNDPNYPNLYGYTYTTQEDSSKVTGHNITISGLKENTEYKYRCISHASPDTIGYEKTFTTCACPVSVLGEEGMPNLKIDKTVNTNFANPGDTVKYEVNITNTGNITAFNTILIDTLPDGFTFKDDKTSSKTWNLGNIENGQVKEVVYDVVIDNTVEEKVYTNLAQASADNHNQISDSADLEIRKIRVLGAELSPTGFSIKEFIILISLLIISLSSILILRKKIS